MSPTTNAYRYKNKISEGNGKVEELKRKVSKASCFSQAKWVTHTHIYSTRRTGHCWLRWFFFSLNDTHAWILRWSEASAWQYSWLHIPDACCAQPAPPKASPSTFFSWFSGVADIQISEEAEKRHMTLSGTLSKEKKKWGWVVMALNMVAVGAVRGRQVGCTWSGVHETHQLTGRGGQCAQCVRVRMASEYDVLVTLSLSSGSGYNSNKQAPPH